MKLKPKQNDNESLDKHAENNGSTIDEREEIKQISEELFGHIKINNPSPITPEAGEKKTIQLTKHYGKRAIKTGAYITFSVILTAIAIAVAMFISQYNFVIMDQATPENVNGVKYKVKSIAIVDRQIPKPEKVYPGETVYITTRDGFNPGFLEKLELAKVIEVHGNTIKVQLDGDTNYKSIRSSAIFFKQYKQWFDKDGNRILVDEENKDVKDEDITNEN